MLYTVDGIFGVLSCVYLGDLFGRKKFIFWTNLTTIIGAVLVGTSFISPSSPSRDSFSV